MKLKPYAFKAIETAALGAGCVCAASFASFAIGGITLFAASPFIPDSSEEAIKGWVAQSALFAAAGASANFLCWHVLFDSVGMNRRSDEGDRQDPLPLVPDFDFSIQITTQTASDEVKPAPPSICQNCLFLNQDISTRSLLLCGVREQPEQDFFCPDFCPDKQTEGGLSNA
jgi:hypothetical protein